MAKIDLKYQGSFVTVDVPDKNLVGVFEPQDMPKVYLVSIMDDETVKDLFFTPVKSAQEALDELLKEYGDDARVLVLPYANSTVPFVK